MLDRHANEPPFASRHRFSDVIHRNAQIKIAGDFLLPHQWEIHRRGKLSNPKFSAVILCSNRTAGFGDEKGIEFIVTSEIDEFRCKSIRMQRF